MPKMELILVRHGETDWNSAAIFRGHEDVRLNSVGIAQADAVGEALESRVFEAIYSSPLKRSLVTATRIAIPHQIDVHVNQGFVDVNYGTWQGLKEATVKQKNPRAYERWTNTPTKMKFPGGDSMKKAWKRVNTSLRELLVLHGLGTVVIVSHRIPLKFMTAYLLGTGFESFPSVKHDPCAISIFSVDDGKFEPIVLNDTRHLAKLRLPEPRDF
ncbi:MAG TPA: histidine phosphatase family protein [Thermoplasmata archaeon]|jgi:broad specificity phosphatase PhoE